MNDRALQASVQTFGFLGTWAFLLPSYERVRQTAPGADAALDDQMSAGRRTFLVLALVMGTAQSALSDSAAPLLVAAGVAAAVLGIYERAYRG